MIFSSISERGIFIAPGIYPLSYSPLVLTSRRIYHSSFSMRVLASSIDILLYPSPFEKIQDEDRIRMNKAKQIFFIYLKALLSLVWRPESYYL